MNYFNRCFILPKVHIEIPSIDLDIVICIYRRKMTLHQQNAKIHSPENNRFTVHYAFKLCTSKAESDSGIFSYLICTVPLNHLQERNNMRLSHL